MSKNNMDKTVLIIHGITGHAGIHWQQSLHDELVKRGYEVLMPEMPDADHPDRDQWLQTVKDLTKNVDFSDLILVGHSLGVATALDLIESEGKKVKALISVSGFGDDYGAELNSYFMKIKNIDFNKVRKNTEKTFVIYGDDDPYVPQETLFKLSEDLGEEPIIIEKGGHLNTRSGFSEFPMLLNLIVKNSYDYQIHKAGGILLKDKKLLVEKSKNKDFFIAPGGSIEKGESPEQGLVRELKEEFQINVKTSDLDEFGVFCAKAAGQGEKMVCMEIFIVKKWVGNIKPDNEVEEIRWITSDIPKDIKVGSIFEHEVVPRLKEEGLIE